MSEFNTQTPEEGSAATAATAAVSADYITPRLENTPAEAEDVQRALKGRTQTNTPS